MPDQVEEVKQKTDIVSLIGEYLPLTKAGRNYKALCPFHSEKTPSFIVSAELQIFKCFGCGESGDAFAFLEKHEGMDFPEALRFLADRAGVKLERVERSLSSEKEKLYKVNELASLFYHYLLLSHPVGKEALNYLTQERGVSLESIKTFKLGFAPNLADALVKFLTAKKKLSIADILSAGLAVSVNGKYVDRFKGRVIFPIFDHRGNAVALAGRVLPSIEKKLPEGVHVGKYINSPETLVYHKSHVLYGLNLTRQAIKKAGRAVVVEGELDLISAWQRGLKNMVAIKGSALTEEQVRLLSRLVSEIVLALDADFAGEEAAKRGIKNAFEMALEVKIASLGKYKDPDDFARENPEGFKEAVEKAVGVWDFLVKSVFKKHNPNSSEGKARVSREVMPILAEIPDRIVQAHFIKLVAEKLEVTAEVVTEELENFLIKKSRQEENVSLPQKPKEKRGRREVLEERLISYLTQVEAKRSDVKEFLALVKSPLYRRILEEMGRWTAAKKKFDLAKFVKSLPEELQEGFAALVLKEEDFVPKERATLKKELTAIGIKESLGLLSVQMKEMEKKGDKQKLREIKEEFSKLTKNLASLEA